MDVVEHAGQFRLNDVPQQHVVPDQQLFLSEKWCTISVTG